MSQERQLRNKVKQYRATKVVFYLLGLPLFVLVVFLSSIRFIGNDPFTGNSEWATQLGFFKDINILFTSPALYGVWIAFGMWLLIAIVHIILSKTVKSRRARTLSVVAFTLVVMLGGMFVIDGVLGAKVAAIAENAPSGVVVQDYKSQLSYYRTVSSGKHSANMTELLIDQVETLEKVYHVEMEGVNKTGVAGAISNKPVTYYDIISDDGERGVDISFRLNAAKNKYELDYSGSGNEFAGDGEITEKVEGKQLVELAPNSKNELVINGEVYSHYFPKLRTDLRGRNCYVWYCKDMESVGWTLEKESVKTDGIYGEGIYANNGLLSDGWIFSFDNVLRILDDYYSAKEEIDANDYSTYYKEIYADAVERREEYYNGDDTDPWLKELYNSEAIRLANFSLTRGELDALIARVGSLLGDNKLFDYLLINPDNFIGDLGELGNQISSLTGPLSKLFEQLNAGLPLSSFGVNSATITTISNVFNDYLFENGRQPINASEIYVCASYKANDCFGREQDHLYIALVGDSGKLYDANDNPVATKGSDGNWYLDSDGSRFDVTPVADSKPLKMKDSQGNEYHFAIDTSENFKDRIFVDIDFDNDFNEDTGVYDFDFNTLSAFLNGALNNVYGKFVTGGSLESTINTVVGIVKGIGLLKQFETENGNMLGLSISGIDIPLAILDSEGNISEFKIDINGILETVLSGLYSYNSAVFKPVWEFYVNPDFDEVDDAIKLNNPEYLAQVAFMKYERAQYEATVHGKMIGSILVGDTLGEGNYPSSFGLATSVAVKQLMSDLSYQPVYFPLYALREMLMLFTGIVVLFYFISFVAAQYEEDFASGKRALRTKKPRKHNAKVIKEMNLDEMSKEADELLEEHYGVSSAAVAEDVADTSGTNKEESANIANEVAEQANDEESANADNEVAETVNDEEVINVSAQANDEEAAITNREDIVQNEDVVDTPEQVNVEENADINNEVGGNTQIPVDENSDKEVR